MIARKRSKHYLFYLIGILLILLSVLLLLWIWFAVNSDKDADSGSTSITTLPANTSSNTTTTEIPSTTVTKPIPQNTDYVKVTDYIPSIYVELKYATTDNITGQLIYKFTDAYLRYGTVKKLITAQNELLESGYSLKIWDAYRPVDAQYKLWQVMPNPKYIANPNNGHTSHSKGNTLDVTLVAADGSEIEVPTEFDNFTNLADRTYSDVTLAQAKHALILEDTMKRNGFIPYSGEWWHFSDTQTYEYVDFNP